MFTWLNLYIAEKQLVTVENTLFSGNTQYLSAHDMQSSNKTISNNYTSHLCSHQTGFIWGLWLEIKFWNFRLYNNRIIKPEHHNQFG